MKKVLIVVDMQNDFINGSLGTIEAKTIVPNVRNKVIEYENNQDLIFYTKDTHFDNYLETLEGTNLPVKHCIKNTDGWQIPQEILRNNYQVIEKYTFGSVDLFKQLQIIYRDNPFDTIELVGLCTDICVISNALLAKAFFPELNIVVDSSSCAGVTKESHFNALSAMKLCQIKII